MSTHGRREFLVASVGLGAAAAAHAVHAGTLGAQQQTANFAPMEQGAYRPTLRAAKPGASPKLTVEERDALEHRIKCQCGCILDIYTCRTTDFTCQVSPAMHRDVLRLVEGGYDAEEILAAFVSTYGEVALTEPVKQGFNWAGYLAPGVAMSMGAVALAFMIRRWSETAQLAVVTDDTEDVPGGFEPVLGDPERLSVTDLIEEQLLLGLPLVPVHATAAQCGAVAAALAANEDELAADEKQRPFANLRELLDKGNR